MNANYWVRTIGDEGFYIHRENGVAAFFQVPQGVDMDSDEYGQALVDSLPDDDTIKAIARHGVDDVDNLQLTFWSTFFAVAILTSSGFGFAGMGMMVGLPLVAGLSLAAGYISRICFRRYQLNRSLPSRVLDPNFIFRHHPARTDSMYPLCRRQDYER